MPKIVNNYTFRQRGARNFYPWDEWLDGKTRRFEQGIDFQTSPESFRASFARTASRAGLKVRTNVEPTGDPDKPHVVYAQAYEPDAES